MSIALVQSNSVFATSGANQSSPYNANPKINNVLTALFEVQGSAATCTSMSISDTLTNTWTPAWGAIQSPAGGSVTKFILGWACINRATGANTISITSNAAGTIGTVILGIAEFTGFNIGGTLNIDQNPTSASAASTTMSPLTITTAQPNEAAFVMSLINQGQASFSVNAPYTAVQVNGAQNEIYCAAVLPSAGSANFGGTWAAIGGGSTNVSGGFTVFVSGGTPPPNPTGDLGPGFDFKFRM